jgi:hypothetical protein
MKVKTSERFLVVRNQIYLRYYKLSTQPKPPINIFREREINKKRTRKLTRVP